MRKLFWSVQPIDRQREISPTDVGRSSASARPESDSQVTLTANIDGRLVATPTVNLLAADFQLTAIQVDAFAGSPFVVLPRSAKRPTINVLGGPENGAEFACLMAPKARGA